MAEKQQEAARLLPAKKNPRSQAEAIPEDEDDDDDGEEVLDGDEDEGDEDEEDPDFNPFMPSPNFREHAGYRYALFQQLLNPKVPLAQIDTKTLHDVEKYKLSEVELISIIRLLAEKIEAVPAHRNDRNGDRSKEDEKAAGRKEAKPVKRPDKQLGNGSMSSSPPIISAGVSASAGAGASTLPNVKSVK
jgi:hypothetical protein